MTATITVVRPRRLYGAPITAKVFLDEELVGTLRNGQRLEVTTHPGRHSLAVRFRWASALPQTFELSDGEEITFTAGLQAGGRRGLSYLETDRADLGLVLPHRRVTIFVVGLLWLAGLAAFLMGRRDLRRMDEGTMDPRGRGVTQAGMWIGLANFGFHSLLLLTLLVVGILGELRSTPPVARAPALYLATGDSPPCLIEVRFRDRQLEAARISATKPSPVDDLLEGRPLTDGDSGQGVTVVSQSLASELFGDTSPLGEGVLVGPPSGQTLTVVGVVGDRPLSEGLGACE